MKPKLTKEQKISIQSAYRSGMPVSRICEEYGISKSTAYFWISPNRWKEYSADTDNPLLIQREIHDMQRTMKRNYLKVKIYEEAHCTHDSPLDDRLSEFLRLSPIYGKNIVLDALNISKGTYHNRIICGHAPTYLEKRREQIGREVQLIFDESGQCYGADKILSILQDKGYRTSKKYILSIMHELGLESIRAHSKRDYMKTKKKNKVKRHFTVSAPNQVWVGDITQFPVKGLYHHVSVIVDLYSRKAVGFKTSTCASSQLVTSTFRNAFADRGCPEGLFFHSDQGSQYTSCAFRSLLAKYNVEQSFSFPGKPTDNAVAESFFSNLKREEIYRHEYRSEREFKARVANYIERYNKVRPHRFNNYKSPDRKEQDYYSRIRN